MSKRLDGRRSGLKTWVPILWSTCMACATPVGPKATIEPKTTHRTLHVDAQAVPEVSDGSDQYPFPTFAQALAAANDGDALHVHDGIYAPIRLDKAVRIQGTKAAVVSGGPDDIVIDVAVAGVAIENVIVQGGRIGIRSAAGVTLSHVAFSAQRRAGLLGEGGAIVASGLSLVANFSIPDLVGIEIRGGSIDLSASTIEGPFRFGFRIASGSARLSNVRAANGTAGFAFLPGSRAEVTEVEVGPMIGACLLADAATVRVRDSLVSQCETGFTVVSGSQVSTDELVIENCRLAGIAALESTLRIEHHVHVGPASHAAIVIEGGEATLVEPLVSTPGAAGVSVHRGRTLIEGGVISGARVDPNGDFGDAVFASAASPLDIRHTCARRNEGLGVDVFGGTTTLVGLDAIDNGLGAVGASGGAKITIEGATLIGSRGVGVAAVRGSSASVRFSRIAGHAEAQVMAACDQGASVTVAASDVRGTQPDIPCVTISAIDKHFP
jgi:hypothetical protein